MARRKRAKGPTLAVVRRGWTEEWGDGWNFHPVATREDDRVLGRPIAVFTDRAAAEARKAELEREARAELNPFQFVERGEAMVDGATSRTAEEFAAGLKALLPKVRLPRPGKYGQRDWCAWWEKVADGLTDEQRAAVWGLFDRLEFYAVVPLEAE